MPDPTQVADHYSRDRLLESIEAGVEALGKTPETITTEDLASVDEFHIGGVHATRAFLDQVHITADDHVLDIGCGVGGTSRFMAHTFGCRVTGVDLTQPYVQAGRTLCDWVGLDGLVGLVTVGLFGRLGGRRQLDLRGRLHSGRAAHLGVELEADPGRVAHPVLVLDLRFLHARVLLEAGRDHVRGLEVRCQRGEDGNTKLILASSIPGGVNREREQNAADDHDRLNHPSSEWSPWFRHSRVPLFACLTDRNSAAAPVRSANQKRYLTLPTSLRGLQQFLVRKSGPRKAHSTPVGT